MKLSVFGIGHLGLPLAALFAAAGHQVTAVDHDEAHIAALQQGRLAWHEPGLADLCMQAASRIKYGLTCEPFELGEVSIIAVPTPAAASGGYDASFVLAAAAAISAGLAEFDIRVQF